MFYIKLATERELTKDYTVIKNELRQIKVIILKVNNIEILFNVLLYDSNYLLNMILIITKCNLNRISKLT